MTFLGAGFIWFFVPETKNLTLEEMDTVFGSSGVAAADQARIDAINEEVGLTAMLTGRQRKTEGDSGSENEKHALPTETTKGDAIQQA